MVETLAATSVGALVGQWVGPKAGVKAETLVVETAHAMVASWALATVYTLVAELVMQQV